MRRIGKMALIWTTVLLLVVDPVSACRWRARWGSCSPCQTYCHSTPCQSSYVVTVDSTTECECATSSDMVTTSPSTEILPSPEETPPLAPTPAPAPTATWGPGPAPGRQPTPAPAPPRQAAPTPAPQPIPTPKPTKPTPAPPKDEQDSLDDLFKEEASAPTNAEEPRIVEPAGTPATADRKTGAGTESAIENGKPAAMDDDIDFADVASGDDNAAEPAADEMTDSALTADPAADEKSDSDFVADPAEADDPAGEMPAADAADDDATLIPDESDEDAPTPDPKSSSAVTGSETEVASTPSVADHPLPADGMRLWTDNTGKHQVRARLVMVLDGKIRLQKETGRFTTVPFERLSLGDLAFVRRQVPTVASAVTVQAVATHVNFGK
ncbi:MAG TPA: SHD1 domain-containing protein [Pirellulales bacterium]|jgi:hypothetical protein|nr:SHD1 domain-containing protein [Pirellulales bacterium]